NHHASDGGGGGSGKGGGGGGSKGGGGGSAKGGAVALERAWDVRNHDDLLSSISYQDEEKHALPLVQMNYTDSDDV
nr:hypothetical protein [Tanacetum cinerariifolium]